MKPKHLIQKFCDEFVVSSSDILGKSTSQETIEICWRDVSDNRMIKFITINRKSGTYSEITLS